MGGLVARGYSGHGDGINNPAMQFVPRIGPIPVGQYRIIAPVDTMRHGPYFLPLLPDAANIMHDREDFGIHGDERLHPNQHLASEGCLIFPHNVREQIWSSPDHELEVVASLGPRSMSA
jgi:hypothetical protein